MAAVRRCCWLAISSSLDGACRNVHPSYVAQDNTAALTILPQ